MRLVMREKDYWSDTSFSDISDVGGTLKEILDMRGYSTSSHTQLLYVSSDPEDYEKGFRDSLMYKFIEFHFNSILLDITIPPGPKASTPTTINRRKGKIIMKVITMEEENKGKERKVQVQVDKRITLAQLKEELVPLIGVPSTGFRVCGISGNEEYELKRLDELVMNLSESKLIVRLGRELQEGEYRIKLYLLQVNSIEFLKFMMECTVAKGTLVREFKKQIIEEAKVQGIDCVLELDKMRLRKKNGVSPGRVYLDELIDTSSIREMYVERLKGPEKKMDYGQRQVYVIRWRPSKCSVDPIEEIILDKYHFHRDFIIKLSELSGVPAIYIFCTQGESFPVEISCLDIENELTWYSITSDRYSLGLYDDGYVIYYKDNREKLKELTDKERSELQEAQKKRQRKKKEQIEKEMCLIILYFNHPVTGELNSLFLEVHKDELLPTVLDKAYETAELAPHIPIERCRLVKYNYERQEMEQSLDLDEFQHLTIRQIMDVVRCYSLFLETCKENEIFKKYNTETIRVSVVALSSGVVGPPKAMRVWLGWTVENLKQHIGEACNLNSSCMRVVMREKDDWSDVGGTLKKILDMRGHSTSHTQLLYVSSDPEDYQKGFRDSLMYKFIEFHFNSILLYIIIPPGPKASTPTTTNRRKGRITMKVISKEENIEKERKIQVQVDKRITLAELKEELVPLIGVPPTGFRVCGINGYEVYELERLDENKILMNLSESKLIVKLGRPLRIGEHRIKLYLLQVNSIEFLKFMMESIVAEDTPVREFKEQIIEEAKVQGIDCVLGLDKMRLRKKNGVSPGRVYLNELIDTSGIREMYVEPLKGPEKKMDYGQRQMYVIRWHPSQFSVDPIEEIILDKYHFPMDFIKKLSELSGVPTEYISYSEGKSFLVGTSCLDIENELTWYSITSDTYSLGLYNDGYVIYYKDNRETMKELTDKERSEILEAEEKRQRTKKEQIEKEMCLIILYCNNPVTGKLKKSFLEVHKDELLPTVLDKAYELMKLAPHIPIERCRLVKCDYERQEMGESLDLDEFQHLTIGRIMDLVGCYSLFLFLETHKENETFKKYNAG
ncbi:PREDICTED: ubiquitin carboxyl-terminal hydrolase 47-like, partial [Amphimedon queenslandica]|uniref:Ubiquitin carboxyl-terminal hydrolase 47 C-terminal domain-containing protein n=1 Tax=Amphimedon queenslandica TaxID=400682 RepID=A0AAN0JW10_AMPQE